MRFSIQKQIQTVFVRDPVFWNTHSIEIENWLVEHDWKFHSRKYGFFEYKNEEQLTMFLLRWS
jgi:hypothetical protein